MRCALIFGTCLAFASASDVKCETYDTASLLQTPGVIKAAAGGALNADTPVAGTALMEMKANTVRLVTAKANFKSAAVFLLAMILGSLIMAMTWLGLKQFYHSVVGKAACSEGERAESESDSDAGSLAESSKGGSPQPSPRLCPEDATRACGHSGKAAESGAADAAKQDAPSAPLSDAEILKVHSAVRWGKSVPELEAIVAEFGGSMDKALAARDPKNGNAALHIAAQNNHTDLTRYILEKKADVNAQNGKGQTALHMTAEYDMYILTKMLLEEFGASQEIANADGHAAITGIDGGKTGGDAWDAPLNLLAALTAKEDLDAALAKLEEWPDKAGLDKAKLIQTGMANKKRVGANWDHARFMAAMKTF